MDERTLRLQERFKVIRQAISETSGDPNIAYAVSTVAWLEVIEYWCLQALHNVQHASEDSAEQMVLDAHQEIRGLLKSFHETLCEHLELDQLDIINRSSAFKEIVNDICNERG